MKQAIKAEYVFDKGYRMIELCSIIGLFFNLVYAVFVIVAPVLMLLYGGFQCL
jgi:hypothetical protein